MEVERIEEILVASLMRATSNWDVENCEARRLQNNCKRPEYIPAIMDNQVAKLD